ncbi:MAG: XdhC/CoxI family protein [Anaerolineae bacterium]|nr:XdhC/CoxI family protein [Thermoflexales bacterium]MDW8408547.1 XdhC/CoxI family protein [Anaerolineae bacterium]
MHETAQLLHLAAQRIEQGLPCALCAVVRASGSVPRHAGSKLLVSAEGEILAGTIGGGEMESRVIAEAQQALRDGAPRLVSYRLTDPSSGDPGVCGGQAEIFIDPLLPPPALFIIGAGHVGRALAHLARWAGFYVIVADDRPDWCSPQAIPEANEHLCGSLTDQIEQIAQRIARAPQSYVALVTRSSPIDVAILPTLLRAAPAYIGVIGSRRRWLTTAQALRQAGVAEADLARVHSPIGLEIEAETPEEIAVSIMAQIVHVRRSGSTSQSQA